MDRTIFFFAPVIGIVALAACSDKAADSKGSGSAAVDPVAQEAYDFSTKWDEACKNEDKKKAAADAQVILDEAVKNPIFKQAYEGAEPKKYADACGRMMRASARATLAKKLKGG